MLITKSYLNKWRTNSFVAALLWAVMGMVLIVIQDNIQYTTCYLLGIVLLVQGVPQLFLFIVEEEKHVFSTISLLTGIIISFLGIWALTLPNEAQKEIPNVIATVTLIHGFKDIALARRIQVLDVNLGKFALLLSVATIICSCIILLLPLEATAIVTICSGILLIIDGISDFWMWTLLTKKSNEQRGI